MKTDENHSTQLQVKQVYDYKNFNIIFIQKLSVVATTYHNDKW